MSGLEVYGGLVATVSLVQFALEVIEHCNKAAAGMKALEQAKILGHHQVKMHRTVFRSLARSLDKLNKDVVELLGPKDEHNIKEIVKDIKGVVEGCEGTMSKLRALAHKTLGFKSKLDGLREELNVAIATIQSLQSSLNTYINSETLRRVSQGNAEHGAFHSSEPLKRHESELENPSPPSRQSTGGSFSSTQTLTSTLSPGSTYSAGSSSGSTGNTSILTCSTPLVESKQLRSAVDEKDSERIDQLIRLAPTKAEEESWKASALFLACSFHRPSLVQSLLQSNPDVYAIDDSGLGVMHATIGLSEQLSEVRERHTADILKLLVNYNPLLIKSVDKHKRQPLHYCAMTGNYRAAQYILGLDPSRIHATDSSKKTPLYHICEHHSPNQRLVKLLLQNGGHFGTRSRPGMINQVRLATVQKMLDEVEKKRKLTLSS